MSPPKPIRISRVEWVCMRNDPVLPKAVIRLVTVRERRSGRDGDGCGDEDGPAVERYRVVTWAPDSADRLLVGYYATLAEANAAVRYDIPDPASVVTGHAAFGMYGRQR
ncbi:hypothetical protein ELQ94_02360 [Labedella endophytica]|jgi:hypothetical protein|uniref:Uncharacterized protein n=2 Tax=Labedella endophytica TaxID=1523160 RepID=A0A3S0VVX9_9MICO|nr:hypothetical protein ELQ94_02360 [Labedella endophytica]